MYRVLLVDDEPFILEGLSDAIDWSAYGLEIAGQAENGRQALERLREKPVDLLITDITMPVMNGLELIRTLREEGSDIKVIILSGYNEFDYLKEGMRLGIENYLLKPINFDELKATLAGTVEKLNAVREEPRVSEADIHILRDNVLYRWLTGSIGMPELRERAELLGIGIGRRYMLAAVLREGTQGAGEAVVREAVSRLAGDIVFTDRDEDLVAVFLFDDPEEGREAVKRRLEELLAALPDAGNVRISLGSAEPVGGGEPTSYGRAKKAQEYFLLQGRPGLVDWADRPAAGEGAVTQVPESEWPEYSRLILAKDKECLRARIAADFRELQGGKNATPGLMQSAAVEMVIRFKLELQHLKTASLPGSGPYKAALDAIMAAASIEELVAAVTGVADLTVDALDVDDKSPVVKSVLQHIETGYAEVMSLKSLGQEFNVHPVYLGQLFHKETGESFTDYVNKYRIEKAKTLLKETHLKVADIARSVGYWETGYFYKQFKKYVGISPTDYKGLL